MLDKPAGMVVHPGAGHRGGTLVNALLHHVKDLSGIGGELRPGIVHRLDRGTSGLMVVAKNDAAHQRAVAAVPGSRGRQGIRGAGLGRGARPAAASTPPIGRDPTDRQKMSTRARRARSAVTRVTWARHFKGVSLLKVAIATGRTHQIRVHLSAIGHPIVGDADLRRRAPPRRRRPARGPAARAAVPARGAPRVHASRRRPPRRVRFAAAAGSRIGARRDCGGAGTVGIRAAGRGAGPCNLEWRTSHDDTFRPANRTTDDRRSHV